MQMFLLHTVHNSLSSVWLLLVALACLSSLTCLTVFFSSHHLHPRVTLLHPLLFCSSVFTSLVLPRLPSLFAYTLIPLYPLKSTKSRGSKHKSRRKPKKQKRPSSVCNPVTWRQNGSRPLWLVFCFFFPKYLPSMSLCQLINTLWLCVISVNCFALASCISF